MLSNEDWNRLDHKFEVLHQEIKDQGSKVYKLENKVTLLDAGSPHKCEEAIKDHEDAAWTHNPKKAIGLGAGIATIFVGILEGVRAFFTHK